MLIGAEEGALPRNTLPLLSEGFFPRSENTFPSILSFFSAARAAGVSIAGGPERTGSQKCQQSRGGGPSSSLTSASASWYFKVCL